MKFECNFRMDINNKSLLDCLNEWRKSDGNEPYNNIEEVPENEIYDIIYEAGYLDTALENVMLEEIGVKKI